MEHDQIKYLSWVTYEALLSSLDKRFWVLVNSDSAFWGGIRIGSDFKDYLKRKWRPA